MNNLILALKAHKSNVDVHRHSAYQIVYTSDNPFHTISGDQYYENIFGFIIRPQVSHSCICTNSNLIVMNVEAYSIAGKNISEKLGSKNTEIFFTEESFMNFFGITGSEINIRDLIRSMNADENFQITDDRVNSAIAIINNEYRSTRLTLDQISKTVSLSSSRLAFLFKQQTGSSIMKFLLWTRIRRAIFLILSQKDISLTSIAHECGFYDSSQMNKYMYQMFGISPLKLRKKSDLIQFLE